MSEGTKELARNKKAYFSYEILETFEAGIVLVGTEVKSLRDQGGSLLDAYVVVEKGELFVKNMHIAPYRFGNVHNHEERRPRKLLFHKKEIERLVASLNEKGLTAVPLSLYLKKGIVKVKIGLARGKKLHDKRQVIKERDAKREADRQMKRYK